MFRRSLRTALAAGAALGMALAFAPALSTDDPATQVVTADDLGLAYAPRLVDVHAETPEERGRLAELGLDTMEHASHAGVEVVLTSALEEEVLREAGFDFEVEIADLVRDTAERELRDRTWAAEVGISDLPSGRTEYRDLADYGAEIDQLVADHPGLAKRISIGSSVEGRDLTGIEIAADVDRAEDGRPVFLMFGVHHAREWPSSEIPMEWAHDLLQGYTDPTHDLHERAVRVLEEGRMVIVPVSNPDGYHTSRVHGDIFDFSFGPAWWRKNCRFVPGQGQPEGTCLAAAAAAGQTSPIGVDLNRNYGGLWGGPGADAGFEDDDYGLIGLGQASGTYRGPAPFSEPETQAIRDLISTRQVTTLITNHTRGHLLLRPNGVAPSTVTPFDGFPRGYAPDECFTRADGTDYGMQALGERMSAQNGYSNQFGWELYDTTGTTEDYSYNATGGYGYTYELMPSGGSFHPDYATVVGEYTGTDSFSQRTTLDGNTPVRPNGRNVTTDGKDDCAGDEFQHEDLGGGLREAYMIAFENAIDARTHSLITGTAPAGAEITVTRTGEFPLWDASTFTDTVTTTMTTVGDGTFEFHVNPSTRPILDSRRYTDPDDGQVKETGRKNLDGEPFEGEYWTVSCNGGAAVDVLVDRGQSVDVGAICG